MATEKTIELQIARAQAGDPSTMGDMGTILSHQARRAHLAPGASALVSLSRTQVETKRKNNDNQ